MRILLLGGAGFIGNALVDYIKNEHILYIVDNFIVNSEYKENYNKKLNDFDNIFLIKSDVSNIDNYKYILSEIEIIIYLASLNSAKESLLYKKTYFFNNVRKLKTFLEKSDKYLKKIKKIILTSSRAVYGDERDLILEDNKKNPLTFYGKTKYCQEKVMLEFCQNKKISLDIFRIFNVYGDNQHNYYLNIGIVPMIYQQIIQNKKVVLLNKGNIVRDFIHIEDVVKILNYSLINTRFNRINIYNLGSGIGISLLEICQIFKKLNYSFLIEFRNSSYNDVVYSVANNQKIIDIYNYSNFFSVKQYIIEKYKKV